MTDHFTPDTEVIRAVFIEHRSSHAFYSPTVNQRQRFEEGGGAAGEFDRWLAAHDAEVRANLTQPMQECGVCGRQYPASDTRDTCPVCWPGLGEHGQQPPTRAEPCRATHDAHGGTLECFLPGSHDGEHFGRFRGGRGTGRWTAEPASIADMNPAYVHLNTNAHCACPACRKARRA